MHFNQSFPRFPRARNRGLTFATQVQFHFQFQDRSRTLLSIQDNLSTIRL